VQDVYLPIGTFEIDVPEGRRPAAPEKVKSLAESIKGIGLRHPITVRRNGDRYTLVAGLHRLRAFERIGKQHIPALIVSMSKLDARMWEIAENLHRAELTVQERSDQIAEWIELAKEKREDERVSSQVAKKPQGGRPESGVNAASRELGLEKDDAYRAVKIASIAAEAKEAAREAGIDSQAALLKVAAAATPREQVDAVRTIIEERAHRNTESEHDRDLRRLCDAWDSACESARVQFLEYSRTT